MKVFNLFSIITLVILVASCGASKKSSSSSSEDLITDMITKEREALKIRNIKEIPSSAKKQAKDYERQGYQIFVGSLPMEAQLETSMLKEVETNSHGAKQFLIGSSMITAATVTVARSQALHAAKVNLVSQTSSLIAGFIETSLVNHQISEEEASTLNHYVEASKELIMGDFGQIDKDFEIYQQLSKTNKNIRVITRISYNCAAALEAERQRLMKGEASELHQKLIYILSEQIDKYKY